MVRCCKGVVAFGRANQIRCGVRFPSTHQSIHSSINPPIHSLLHQPTNPLTPNQQDLLCHSPPTTHPHTRAFSRIYLNLSTPRTRCRCWCSIDELCHHTDDVTHAADAGAPLLNSATTLMTSHMLQILVLHCCGPSGVQPTRLTLRLQLQEECPLCCTVLDF
jgi:hypothetical protein